MCVEVPILDDDETEEEEVFLVLADSLDPNVNTYSTASVTIFDNDGEDITVHYISPPLLSCFISTQLLHLSSPPSR